MSGKTMRYSYAPQKPTSPQPWMYWTIYDRVLNKVRFFYGEAEHAHNFCIRENEKNENNNHNT